MILAASSIRHIFRDILRREVSKLSVTTEMEIFEKLSELHRMVYFTYKGRS